ncbi:MAG TPA: hypothetical protein PK969_12835 [Treponemataceae bacterium]|nr:hypothetical protein [Treponemataceae bacterium]
MKIEAEEATISALPEFGAASNARSSIRAFDSACSAFQLCPPGSCIFSRFSMEFLL